MLPQPQDDVPSTCCEARRGITTLIGIRLPGTTSRYSRRSRRLVGLVPTAGCNLVRTLAGWVLAPEEAPLRRSKVRGQVSVRFRGSWGCWMGSRLRLGRFQGQPTWELEIRWDGQGSCSATVPMKCYSGWEKSDLRGRELVFSPRGIHCQTLVRSGIWFGARLVTIGSFFSFARNVPES